MDVFLIIALLLCAALGWKLSRLEERVDDLEEWADSDVHEFFAFEPDDGE